MGISFFQGFWDVPICREVPMSGPHVQISWGNLLLGGGENAYERHALSHRALFLLQEGSYQGFPSLLGGPD